MHPLGPMDHFNLLFEVPNSPMNICALMLFGADSAGHRPDPERLFKLFVERAPHTVLAQRMVQAPDDFTPPYWYASGPEAARAQVSLAAGAPWSQAALEQFAIGEQMTPLDLDQPPFKLMVLGETEQGESAVFLKIHHALMDGIGLQNLIAALADDASRPTGNPPLAEAVLGPVAWRAHAQARYLAEAEARAQQAVRKTQAERDMAEFLADPGNAVHPAAEMAFGPVLSAARAYRPISLPLEPIRSAAKQLGGSVNDGFLATAASALRRFLLERDQLPAQPLLSNSVRSTRRPESGLYGNHVLLIYPELATDCADPKERFRRIHASMQIEKRRSDITGALQDQFDSPWGARDRKAICADLAGVSATIGASNVVLSNVPGPAELLRFAGHPLVHNFPVPIVGPGRFLNITSRRNGDWLDLGVMVDAKKITEIDAFAEALKLAVEELVVAAGAG